MIKREVLEREIHQLRQIIRADAYALISKSTPITDKARLRKQIDIRTAMWSGLSKQLRGDSKRQISGSHRQVLLPMGLIVVAAGEEMLLTEAGRRRLTPEERAPTHSSTGFVEQGPDENVEPR
jgi:hypothetical protein